MLWNPFHLLCRAPDPASFQRECPGRASISEKRHAHIDAKKFDLFQKIRPNGIIFLCGAHISVDRETTPNIRC